MNVPEKPFMNLDFCESYKIISYGGTPSDDIDWEQVKEKASYYEHFVIQSFIHLGTTKDIEDFFRAFPYMLKQLDVYDKVKAGGIDLPALDQNEVYIMLTTDKSLVLDEFITRTFDASYKKAQTFKTKDARNNYMKRYFKLLKLYEGQMCSDNIQRLRALEMMIEVNGVEPKATLKQKK